MTKYGISEISVVPVRKESDDKSEMTTQLLFGETFEIVGTQNGWSYIKIAYDTYEGWIDSKNISSISEDFYKQINSETVVQHISTSIVNDSNQQLLLPAGSTIPNFDKNSNSFKINDNHYRFSENYSEQKLDIIALSKQFLNSPYLWGGKNPFGIDCSGFVQVVFKMLGKKLLRDANEQVDAGEIVNFISEVEAGDLAFFDNEEGNIIHVGIVLNYNEIIHASGKVRIDKLDQQGIYNSELNKYTHKLRVIKRIL